MLAVSSLFFHSPLGMNLRNYIIRKLNPPCSLRLAGNKVSFKEVLEANGVPTPHTYHVIHDFTDMKLVGALPEEFVVKPAQSSGGRGVALLKREQDYFINPSGDRYTVRDVELHIRKILDGDFSGYRESDTAIIEERVYPSPSLQFKDLLGLPDIRVFCVDFQPVMAMLRYPTFKSKGRSNLAAGGIGMGLSLDRGTVTYVHSKKEHQESSPADLGIDPSFVMPKWEEMKTTGRRCSELSGLRFSGVDIVLSAGEQVTVLEINGRPGLEIQNINERSLLMAAGLRSLGFQRDRRV